MESFTSRLNSLPNGELQLQCASSPASSHCPGATCHHRLHPPDPRDEVHHPATLALLLDQAESPTVPPPPSFSDNPCLASSFPPQPWPLDPGLPPSRSCLPPVPSPAHPLSPPGHLQLPLPQREVGPLVLLLLALLALVNRSHDHLRLGSTCNHILSPFLSSGFKIDV